MKCFRLCSFHMTGKNGKCSENSQAQISLPVILGVEAGSVVLKPAVTSTHGETLPFLSLCFFSCKKGKNNINLSGGEPIK